MGFFSKIKEGLQKTRDAMMQKMQAIINSFTKIDEDLFEQLEETMIMSDMGVDTSVEICERLRKLVKERGEKDPKKIMGLIEEIISDMLGEETELDLSTKPSVIMVIGVNGAGKTTTIGKLCHQFKNEGKKVLVAAADTFRAAAIDQLQVWTQRAGVDIVKHAEGSDPAAVVFDAITAAVARECDVLIIDTAGRLHNKKNLMNELAKINRILEQKAEGCAVETLLVLDATTGQNAVSQAKLFNEAAKITGIVLTKLDGTAKGGIIVSIKNELGIPVKLVGVGEKIEDLQRFNNAEFIRALFDHSDDVKIEEKPEEVSVEEEVVPEAEPEETPSEEAPVPEAEPEETPSEETPVPEAEPEEAPAEEEFVPEAEPEEIPVEEAPVPETEPEEIPAEKAEPEEEKKKPFSWLFMEIGPKKKEKEEKESAPKSEPEENPSEEETPKKKKSWFSFGKKGE